MADDVTGKHLTDLNSTLARIVTQLASLTEAINVLVKSQTPPTPPKT